MARKPAENHVCNGDIIVGASRYCASCNKRRSQQSYKVFKLKKQEQKQVHINHDDVRQFGI